LLAGVFLGALPHVKSGKLRALGADAAGSSPGQLAAFLKTEMAKWAKVVKAAGIRSE